jgi:hypothetical protein
MRSVLAATLVPLVPFLLAAQDPAAAVASPAVQEWQKQNAATLAAYEADREKTRAKVAKSVVDLERREDSWLSLARDFFGMTNNNRMDPDYFDRRRRERREDLAKDDSTAVELIAAMKTGSPATTAEALKKRVVTLAGIMPENDSSYVEARRTMNTSSRAVDYYKSEENPSLPPDTKQFVKRAIDYFDKLGRAARSRADYHEERGKAWRTELNALNRQIAAANAAMSQ